MGDVGQGQPGGRHRHLPNLSENLLDPAGQPAGIVHKMIIDATTPFAPDLRGNYGEELDTPTDTDLWRAKLTALIKEIRKSRIAGRKHQRRRPRPRCRIRAKSGLSASRPLPRFGPS